MNCQNIKVNFPGYLTGELNDNEQAAIKKHIAHCDTCRDELENIDEVWTRLGVLPEEQPPDSMRRNFYTMLESYKAGLEQKQGFLQRLASRLQPFRPILRPAFAVIILMIGFFFGRFLPLENHEKGEKAELLQEVRDLKTRAALSMLSHPAPGDRLQGVIWSSRLENPGSELIRALLDTLDNDPNVNVRLSAVDALYLFSDKPEVRQGLIDSLARQESPLVQIALIDLISHTREKRAAQALKNLLRDRKLNPAVKQQAERSLQQLI